MEAGKDESGAMMLMAARLSQRSTPGFQNGMDGGLVRSSPVPPPNRGLILFERSLGPLLHAGYVDETDMFFIS